MTKEHEDMLREVVERANYFAHEYDQAITVIGVGDNVLNLEMRDTDEDEVSGRATLGVRSEIDGQWLLVVCLEGEEPRLISAHGHTLFAILYC